jgi:hypothetical protein
VLFDESVPHDVAAATAAAAPEHVVATVQGLGWAGTKNGALLRAARGAGYEVLVTTDRNMRHQQNIPASGLAVLVLRARSSRVPDLLAVVPPLLVALSGAAPGTVTELRGA